MSKIFFVDVKKCIGCYNCQIACKDEHCDNDWTPYAKPQPVTGQFWCKVNEDIRGNRPQMRVSYYPVMCMHCDDAPCIEACLSEAIYKRDDGLVIIDPKKCTGHQLCIDACPYGTIYFNQNLKIAQKCTGCAHLLDRGWPIAEPRCTDACYLEVLKFGEEADFQAEIAESNILKPEENVKPRIYYKNLPKKFIAGTVYDPDTKEVLIGATCTLSGDGDATTSTDEFGDFWFEDLEEGTYSLSIEAAGKTKTISDISTEKDVGLGDIPLS